MNRVLGDDRGFTLLEVTIALVVAGIAFTFSAQLLGSTLQLEKTVNQRAMQLSAYLAARVMTRREILRMTYPVPGSVSWNGDTASPSQRSTVSSFKQFAKQTLRMDAHVIPNNGVRHAGSKTPLSLMASMDYAAPEGGITMPNIVFRISPPAGFESR